MRLLLDTHVALWAVAGARKLPPEVTTLLVNPRNRVFVSVVSIAEIAIKYPLSRRGAGSMPVGPDIALDRFEDAGFEVLNLSARHAIALASLPAIHGDPFDRLLIAQAYEEPMRLVTHDAVLASYSDQIIHF